MAAEDDIEESSFNLLNIVSDDRFEKVRSGNFTTIPEFFKNNGYRSIGIGKIFHHGHGSHQDDLPSWSPGDYHRVLKSTRNHWNGRSTSWRAVTPPERKEKPLPDDYVAEKAVELLKNMNASENDTRPFFMAVGFYKPHLPLVFPSQYLNLYTETLVDLPNTSMSNVKIQDIAWVNWEIISTWMLKL